MSLGEKIIEWAFETERVKALGEKPLTSLLAKLEKEGEMGNSMGEELVNALEPEFTIVIETLGGNKQGLVGLTDQVMKSLFTKYQAYADKQSDKTVIFLRRRK
jgi:hypothetical protein